MSLRRGDTIDVIGVNDDFCRISDPFLTWGPFLAPGSTGLFDMPIQTNWGNYAFGQFFSSWKPKRRDVVWTINVLNPITGTALDRDHYLWHDIVSRWKAMFSPDKQTIVRYTSQDGERELGMQIIDTTKSFSTYNWEGIDPSIFVAGSVVQAMGCELPYYVAPSEVFEKTIDTPGDSWFNLPYFNPCGVDIFAEWDIDQGGGAQLVLPDYSYFNEIHGRGISDLGKTVLTPLLVPGDGGVNIYTRLDMETYISENETLVGGRAAGRDFEYPIPPGSGDPDEGCVVRVIGAVDEVNIRLTLPRWHDSPFSTPLVV